ncbi:g8236 [Coccomyxa elongata]
MWTRRALYTVCCIVLIAAAQGGDVAATGEEAAPEKVFKAAPSADPVPQNGTTNGEGNGKFYIKIGGSSSLASLQSSSDGTGNGNTGDGSGNNNGNRATGNGNGNGNGNNNAQITIQNDPAFLTCPPCQYYDPSTQLCVTVQSCVNSKPVTPALPAPPAGTLSVGGSSVTAGRKMRL